MKVVVGNSDKISITEPGYFRDSEIKELGVSEEFAEDFCKEVFCKIHLPTATDILY